MKADFDPKKLPKKQRHMKKYIPDGVYCEGGLGGKHNHPCPFFRLVWRSVSKEDFENLSVYTDPEQTYKSFMGYLEHPYQHKRAECQFSYRCTERCDECKMTVTHCDFLNYTEYGVYPLGDQCKVCGVHMNYSDCYSD